MKLQASNNSNRLSVTLSTSAIAIPEHGLLCEPTPEQGGRVLGTLEEYVNGKRLAYILLGTTISGWLEPPLLQQQKVG